MVPRVAIALVLSGCSEPAPEAAPRPAAQAPASPPDAELSLSGPMDHHPGRRTLSPGGAWQVVVAPGGDLSVQAADGSGQAFALDQEVDARVAVSTDDRLLVYARQGTTPETDLWLRALPDGDAVQVTDWRGSEDRPVLSPDGRRLAFVSGHTGIASWWVVDLDGALPVSVERARQLTNVGLESQPRGTGRPPDGWVPVPDGHEYAWTSDGLSWVARDQRHGLQP